MANDPSHTHLQHPFLADLPPASLALLNTCARPARFESGQCLTRAGTRADRFYLLLSGKVQITAPNSTRPVVVHTAAHGEWVGWSWVVPPYRYRFDTFATEPTLAVEVDGAQLRIAYAQQPELGYPLLLRITAALGSRVEDLQLRLQDYYGAPCR